jgi:hypothetical protein
MDELTTWQRMRWSLLGIALCIPLMYVRNHCGLEAAFLSLAIAALLVVVAGVAYFVAVKEGIEAAIRAAVEALGGAILFVLLFGFAGMVAWEIVVSVWRHFPQGW